MSKFNYVTLSVENHTIDDTDEVRTYLHLSDSNKKRIKLLFPDIPALAFERILMISDTSRFFTHISDEYLMEDIYLLPMSVYLSLYDKFLFISECHYSPEFHSFLKEKCCDEESVYHVYQRLLSDMEARTQRIKDKFHTDFPFTDC